jgi:hypothetical protein
MTTPSPQFDRSLEHITTHLRAHVAELRRLEQTGAAASKLEERRSGLRSGPRSDAEYHDPCDEGSPGTARRLLSWADLQDNRSTVSGSGAC